MQYSVNEVGFFRSMPVHLVTGPDDLMCSSRLCMGIFARSAHQVGDCNTAEKATSRVAFILVNAQRNHVGVRNAAGGAIRVNIVSRCRPATIFHSYFSSNNRDRWLDG